MAKADELDKLAAYLGRDRAEIAEMAMSAEGYGQESDALLLFLDRPDRFWFPQCKECGSYFGTNNRLVAYCSSKCKIDALAKVGIKWNPLANNDEERWGGTPPFILSPRVIAVLRKGLNL